MIEYITVGFVLFGVLETVEKRKTMEKEDFADGTLGLVIWKNCVSAHLDDNELTVRVPFKNIVIPLSHIDRVIASHSFRTPLGLSNILNGVYLKIVHHYTKAPKTIYFSTAKKDSWFKAFQAKQISVEGEA